MLKIVFLDGGLANQAFQYIFYRYGMIECPKDDWYLDDSTFSIHNIHNGYELADVFGVKPQLLSSMFDKDVWEYMIEERKKRKCSIAQLFLDNDINIHGYFESDLPAPYNSFTGQYFRFYDLPSKVVTVNENAFYYGYYICNDYLKAHADIIKAELQFPPLLDDKNINYQNDILNSESVSLHIRRGDYVEKGYASDNDIPIYKKMIENMHDQLSSMKLFVFSDDIEWCKDHAEELGINNVAHIFVEGNRKTNSYKDMQLMSMCKHMILCNSLFSYLAALLNNRLDKYIMPVDRKI